MSHRNGPQNLHYHNVIKSTNTSAVYTPSSNINSTPLTDRYTVGENIGRGKFAVVRKCTNKQTGEVVAAKFIKKRRRGKSCREEILREVVMLEMALEHPRLVNLKEVYETQQELILITEYCAGGELFTECILEEKFNESDVRQIMVQILEGMVFLHDKNIVHLDLKPQNILLTDEFPKGSIKICDLGFACLVNTGEDIRDIIGTPDYVAPEVLNYDPLGLYTDMWSLGVLTYVMLTTCSPFAGEDKQTTFSNITTVNLDFPEDMFADISTAAQDFIQKLLIAEPSERMTAKECFGHKWLSGVESLYNPLSLTGAKPPNLTAGSNKTSEETSAISVEAEDVTVVTWTDKSLSSSKESSRASSRDELDELVIESVGLGQTRESTRVKIADQSSEMSVTGGKEEEGIDSGTEVLFDAPAPDVTADSSDSTVVGEVFSSDTLTESVVEIIDKDAGTESVQGFIIESKASRHYLFPEDNEIIEEPVKSISVQEVITPETDSSMCISDTKVQETDSGFATAAEDRDLEIVDESERISAGQDESENIETDFNSEINEDIEMLNKSSVEVKDSGVESDISSTKIQPDQDAKCQTDLTQPFGEVNEISVGDESSWMETENSQSSVDNKVSQTNENNSAKSMIVEHSSERFDFASMDSSSMSIDESSENSCFTKGSTRDQEYKSICHSSSFGEFIKDEKYAIAESRGRGSVGGIDDSINSMQLGERHKRGMCNDSTSPGAENSGNNETEYEFVSVSKRVRSYEDSLASRSPPFSPKIPRSPRISRHSRYHQHH